MKTHCQRCGIEMDWAVTPKYLDRKSRLGEVLCHDCRHNPPTDKFRDEIEAIRKRELSSD